MTNPRLLLVNYHYLRDPKAAPYPGIYPLRMQELAAQVDQLAARFHMATPVQAESFLLGGGALPRDAVLLTFDDGLREQSDAAREVLDPRGVKGVFFVTSRPLTDRLALMVHKVHWLRANTEPKQFADEFEALMPPEWTAARADEATRKAAVGQYKYDTPADALLKYRLNFQLPHDVADAATSAMLRTRGIDEAKFCTDLYMSESEIRDLVARGHAIGSHSHSHAALSRLSASALDADIERNLATLAGVLGGRSTWHSYPYGREWAFPADPTAFCRRHGFRLAVTLIEGWNGPGEDPALIKRVNTNDVAKAIALRAA